MKYYAIIEPRYRRTVSVADEDALGRVLVDHLQQYTIGGAMFLVKQITKQTFDEYRTRAGSVRV